MVETLNSIRDHASDIGAVIVSDDGSSRQSVLRLESILASSDLSSRIELVRHSRNRGGGAARNTAVRRVQTEWVFNLDSDNLLGPGLIEDLALSAMERELDSAVPQVIAFFSSAQSSPTHAWRFAIRDVDFEDFFIPQWIVPPASGNYLYSYEAWSRVRGYPEDSGPLDTWGFGLRQIASGQRMQAVAGTVQFHRHGHSSYWRDGDQSEMRRTVDALVCEVTSTFPSPHTYRVSNSLVRSARRLSITRRGIRFLSDLFPHSSQHSRSPLGITLKGPDVLASIGHG